MANDPIAETTVPGDSSLRGFVPPAARDNRSPAISVGTDYDTELTPWMDYLLSFQATFLDDASGTYQHHLLTTLSTDLVGDIDLDVSVVWDRTQNPPKRADGSFPDSDDFRLLVGLSYEF